MKNLIVGGGILLLLLACTGTVVTSQPLPSSTPTYFPAVQYFTATWTNSPAPTSTASVTPTPKWVVQGPGDVTVPILLFHHIGFSAEKNRYYVPPKMFETEIKTLREWGYVTITTQMLVQAVTLGRELPPHSMLITFDDGNADIYTNAFPIMKKYGYTGVLYIVGNYLGADGFMDRDQILEMYHAGWEVGCHSMSHLDLTKMSPEDQRREIVESKEWLQNALGIDILTFAYPFGAKNDAVMDYVRFAGYMAAMGAEGYTDSQGTWNLLDLQRVEIKASDDVNSMARFFTWHGPTGSIAP